MHPQNRSMQWSIEGIIKMNQRNFIKKYDIWQTIQGVPAWPNKGKVRTIVIEKGNSAIEIEIVIRGIRKGSMIDICPP